MKYSLESQLDQLLNVDKSFYLDYLSDLYKLNGDINDSLKRSYLKYLNLNLNEPVLYDFFRELENLNEDFDIENGDYNDIIIPKLKEYKINWAVSESQEVINHYRLTTYGFSMELIETRIDNAEIEYYEGEIYDTDYIDSSIGRVKVTDIEEL